MKKIRWFSLGAAAALLSASPALAAEGQSHGAGHAHAQPVAKPKPSYGKQAKGRTVEVTVTSDGFVPAQIPAKPGEVLNLVVTRTVEKTCADTIVQKGQDVFAPLPFEKPVTVTMTAPKDGKPLMFSCPHGHMTGTIVASK
jgi:hypothetical protein